MRNATRGLAVAVALAVAIANPLILGIDAWKIILALGGFLLFASGRKRE